jgi:glutamine amidotransferase
MKIVIIDYGMGNIKSIVSSLKYLGVTDIEVSNEESVIKKADKIILPGVGSFSKAMDNIKSFNLDKILKEQVLNEKKPILGICLGMQLLFQSSNEEMLVDGLAFIKGIVRKFNINEKVPHVGFNQVSICKDSILYNQLNDKSDFYFTHSFRAQSEFDINQSICNYGEDFIASFEVDNIFGVQYHPELSQTNGLKLLDNFIKNN